MAVFISRRRRHLLQYNYILGRFNVHLLRTSTLSNIITTNYHMAYGLLYYLKRGRKKWQTPIRRRTLCTQNNHHIGEDRRLAQGFFFLPFFFSRINMWYLNLCCRNSMIFKFTVKKNLSLFSFCNPPPLLQIIKLEINSFCRKRCFQLYIAQQAGIQE